MMISRDALNGVRLGLFFPPYRESHDVAFLKAAKEDLGKIPPLSLCAVAACAEQHGATVQIVDANATGMSLPEVIDEITAFSPDVLGFTLATYQFHFTLSWIKKIREHVDVPVVVGGSHATIYPREVLSHAEIDFCVIGDAENSLPQLLAALAHGEQPEEIPGVARTDHRTGAVAVNRHGVHLEHLDDVPFASRHLLDNSLYYSLISKRRNFTAMTSSRGCTYSCAFCDNRLVPYRAMTAERVVDEMEACHRDHGVNEIDMFDGVFSIQRERLLAVCEAIRRRRLSVAWSFRTRADLVDDELLAAAAGAGCIRINYGIESGSPEVLRNVRKEVALERIREAVIATRGHGIETLGYFMIGNRGESPETVRETLELMLSLPLDHVQISPIYYPPATEIYEQAMEVIGHDYWSEHTVDPGHAVEFPILGTPFSKVEIDRIVRRMYLRFYLRPRTVLEHVRGFTSLGEMRRAGRALFNMAKDAVLR